MPLIQLFVCATCGDSDLQTRLPNQRAHLKLPCPLAMTGWINIKVSFEQIRETKAFGMTNMLDSLNLAFEGRHHSGIDDCKSWRGFSKR